jgi:diaminopimelate epimerase
MDWREIPVARACDTNHACRSASVRCKSRSAPTSAIRTRPSSSTTWRAIPITELGPKLEHDPFFPERVNVGVAQVIGENKVKLSVWERGAGLTLACGSGACAAGVAAARRGLTGRKVDVVVEHGTLTIEWLRDDHVSMTGGIALAYRGELDRSLLS